MAAFGILLIILGLGWAGLGILNLASGLAALQASKASEAWQGFALLFNMALLILPGSALAGLGFLVRGRTVDRNLNRPSGASASKGLRPCPACAESIKLDAKLCRFCGRDVPMATPAEAALVLGQRACLACAKFIDVGALTCRWCGWDQREAGLDDRPRPTPNVLDPIPRPPASSPVPAPPRFTSREEYERWKAERAQAS